jgi:hypothetical protein
MELTGNDLAISGMLPLLMGNRIPNHPLVPANNPGAPGSGL